MLTLFRFKTIGKAALAALIAAGTLMATPAQARHRDRGGDDAAIAIGAGIIGIAIGAAIASDRGDDYYDRRHYRRGYYPRHGSYYYESYPRYRRDYRGHYRDRRDYRRDRHYRNDRRRYHSDRRYYRR